MKLITANQTKEFKNSDICTAIEYPLGDPDMNIAIIKLAGRYPEKGSVVNEECKEIAYVMEGEGELIVEGNTTKMKKGDAALILAKEKFYWNGTMTLMTICNPAWKPEQHKELND